MFFTKDFEGKWGNFTTFANIEINNNFNFEKNWGQIKLEEAWARYNYSDAFNVKVGLFIPTFNNFNEIKNRMPIIPYLFRPLVYEETISEVIPLQDFIPLTANLQIQGNIPVTEDITSTYALFLGNSEDKYYSSQTSGIVYRGMDTTTFKMIGGRIGLKYRSFKFGVSGTYDRDNQSTLFEGSTLNPNLKRYRVGGDLSFTYGDFSFETEFIKVIYDVKNEHKDFIKNYSKNVIVKKYGDFYNLSNELDNLNDTYNNINLPSPSDPNYINLKNQRMLLLSQIQQKQLQLQQMFTQLQKVSKNRLYLGDTYDKLFYYLSLGYNITDEFMPYVSYSYYEDGLDARFKDGMQQYSFGIVYRPITEVVLKAQWTQQNVDKINYKSNFYHAGISVMF
ncbi:MAG TPA: hypothetical protein PK887_01495 [Ignavibacteriales bacterium]|nr:hypothetical protein [Ignavibacteriales bacterium]